ncbi:unnamed protein product [Closterium sp. NIES-65]|nr:unnamed protein product [Closterium sp. NIES-65]
MEKQPISLVYEDELWENTIRYFLTHHGQHITSLDLIFTEMDQLPSLRPLITRCSPSLSSFRLKLRGFVTMFDEHEYKDWTLSFLQNCSHLQRLKLGRGMWNLEKSCANAAWLKSIRRLTLKQVDTSHVNFEYIDSITPQLHEFTLYLHWHLSRGPVFGSHAMTFSFPNARLLRFRFASNEFKLTLSVSPALKTLSVMAKWLVLSCKSTAPLALDHLSLYGQERLVISSLPIASVRAAYLNGPASDEESSCPGISYQLPPSWQHVPRGISGFSWTEWLRSIAQNVEVLVVRHGIPIHEVGVEWRNLRSLGIVMHAEGPHNKEWEATVENYRAFMEDGEFDDDLDEDGGWGGCYGDDDEEEDDDEDEDGFDDDDEEGEYGGRGCGGGRGGSRKKKAPAKPPSIDAPNLQFFFFPSRKACDAATLAALRQDYPAPGALLCGGPLLLLAEEGAAGEQCAAQACAAGEERGAAG